MRKNRIHNLTFFLQRSACTTERCTSTEIESVHASASNVNARMLRCSANSWIQLLIARHSLVHLPNSLPSPESAANNVQVHIYLFYYGVYLTNIQCPGRKLTYTHNIIYKKTINVCCLYKKGVDYCGAGHNCHARAQCINLQTTFACHCLPGFTGDGKHCTGK